MLAYGCGTTLSELEDDKNSVSLDSKIGRLKIQNSVDCTFPLPKSAEALLATIAAAHAVFYVPFKGPSKTLVEVVYCKALNFNIQMSGASKKVVASMLQLAASDDAAAPAAR